MTNKDKKAEAVEEVRVATRYLNDVVTRTVEHGLGIEVDVQTVTTPQGNKPVFALKAKV